MSARHKKNDLSQFYCVFNIRKKLTCALRIDAKEDFGKVIFFNRRLLNIFLIIYVFVLFIRNHARNKISSERSERSRIKMM